MVVVVEAWLCCVVVSVVEPVVAILTVDFRTSVVETVLIFEDVLICVTVVPGAEVTMRSVGKQH